MFGQAFRNDLYNDSLSVGVADGLLNKTNHLADFLASSAILFARHEVNDFAGVFLIHRHNLLAKGSVMIETNSFYNENMALITRPRPVEEMKNSVPTRWVFCNGQFDPFEYSDDSQLNSHVECLASKKTFLSEFACLLEQHQVAHLLGLCIFERELYINGPDDHLLVEITDDDISANVVQWVGDSIHDERLIKTVWCFPAVKNEEGLACTPTCISRCRFSSPDDSHYNTHKMKHTNIG